MAQESQMNRPLKVLHIDDNPFELERIKVALPNNKLGVSFEIESFSDPEVFLKRLTAKNRPDIVILDVDLGRSDFGGITLADRVRKALSTVAIIMCSGMDDASTIFQCLSAGADDFISKKSDSGELSLRVINSFKLAMFKHGSNDSSLHPQLKSEHQFAGKCLELISNRIPRILDSAISAVHIYGESGTGKEVVSEIFESYLSKGVPFMRVNCGAITPTLLESELFGHVKGAFTGASSDKRGYIESSDGGWIFLDEVATLTPSAQTALLRAVENQEIIRVGDNKIRKIKVKFLSATNENLEQKVKDGEFRKDLWQRLCEADIHLAPLRDRPDEIEELVRFFCKTMKGGPYEISPPALEALCGAQWSDGNIRELRNTLRAMTELHVDKLLTPISIPSRFWDTMDESPDAIADEVARRSGVSKNTGRQIVLSWSEKDVPTFDLLADKLLLELTKLMAAGGKVSLRSLSKDIGVSRSTLSGRLKGLVQKGLIDLKELASYVGISDGL